LSSKKVDEISPGVNFINILRVAFFADILAQKNYKAESNQRKAAQFAFVQKMCM